MVYRLLPYRLGGYIQTRLSNIQDRRGVWHGLRRSDLGISDIRAVWVWRGISATADIQRAGAATFSRLCVDVRGHSVGMNIDTDSRPSTSLVDRHCGRSVQRRQSWRG